MFKSKQWVNYLIKNQKRLFFFIYLFFFLIGISLLFITSNYLNKQQYKISYLDLKIKSEILVKQIQFELSNRITALQSLRLFYLNSTEVTESEYRYFVNDLLKSVYGIEELIFIDKNNIIQRSTSTPTVINDNHTIYKISKKSLYEDSLSAIKYTKGDKNYLICALPFLKGKTYLGSGIIVFSMEGIFLSQFMINHYTGFSMELKDDNGDPLYSINPTQNPNKIPFLNYTLKINDRNWNLIINLKEKIKFTNSYLKNSVIMWAAIIMISALLGFASQSYIKQNIMKKQLQKSLNDIEDFIFTVSHGLKAPLLTIEGYTKVLRETIEPMNGNSEKYLSRISECVNDSKEIINIIINIGKIGKIDFETREINSLEIINKLADKLKNQYFDIDFNINIDSNLPTINLNQLRFEQIIDNLFDNAIKYRNPSRKLEIKVGCEYNNDKYIFYVKDNGIGIPKQYTEKVFDLFSRLNSNSEKGHGIGLNIVKKIVENYNGKIWIESDTNIGTTVFLMLNISPIYKSRIHPCR